MFVYCLSFYSRLYVILVFPDSLKESIFSFYAKKNKADTRPILANIFLDFLEFTKDHLKNHNKNHVYKNVEAQITLKFKNTVRKKSIKVSIF